MKDVTFWVSELCDADWRERVVKTAETKELREWFASKTIEEAIRAHEILEARAT